MPDLLQQNYAKKFAFEAAGKTVLFRETEGDLKREGRVVGYYPAMAQVVLELVSEPRFPIDPLSTYLKPVAPLEMNRSRWYICVELGLIDVGVRMKDSRYPGTCPRCSAPAYVGVVPSSVDCSNFNCVLHR